MTTLDFKEVESFLNSNPDFLGTFLAKNDSPKTVSQRIENGPQLSMSKCVEKLVSSQRTQKKKIIDATMDENQRFSEFVKDIAGELNVDALSHKILQNVINLTGSDRGRLFLVEGLDEKYLVSKLFDVTATSLLDETIQNEENAIHVPFGKGIVGMVAGLRIPMNIKDAHKDPRFDPEVDTLAGYKIQCILCMPILNKDGEVVGVAEIMNKKEADYFSEQDEILFSEYLNFCGIGINNARLFQMSIEEIQRNQLLLNLAWQISTGQSNIDHVIKVILEYALKIIRCKFVSVCLLNPDCKSFSKCYRLNNPNTDVIITKGEYETAYTTIAKESLQSKERIFVTNLNDKPEFVTCANISFEENADDNKVNIDKYEEDANWVLCTSVHDLSDVCIGCIMFAGKIKPLRCQADTNSVEAFAVYCGLGIYNCQLYQTTVKSLTVKQVVLEILSYHMTSEKAEVDRYVHLDMPSVNECKIYDYTFNDAVLSEVSTVQACALMFLKMNALNILGISLEQLYHWILTVKKNYKPLLYHNWRHALNVCQTMFCALNKGDLKKYFSPFEYICLLVASLCHDLDYEGSCSAQNLKSTSLLATIFSTSPSQHQVLGRCVMILNSDATNIFQKLTAEKYRQAMQLIKKAILATDIHVYILNEKLFEDLKKKKAPLQSEQDTELLIVLTMVSCDLIAFSKPWNYHKIIVLAATLELFEPSESENEAPALQKSESEKIPTLMIEFIDIVCLNVFKAMSEFDKSFLLLHEGCLENRKHWDNIARKIEEFDLETELNKSRAGLIDFDEPLKDEKVNDVEVKSLEPATKDEGNAEKEKEKIEKEMKEEELRKEKEEKEKGEKEMKEKEDRERKEKEDKEMKEKEKDKEDKEREEKERKENEEREKKEKEEREKKEKEEREKKEKEEREKKELEEKERKAREEKEMEEKIKKEKEKQIQEKKEKEKKEKEEKERIEKEKEEAKKKEMEAKKKEEEKQTEKQESVETENGDDPEHFKDNVKEQLMARMSDKLINLKSTPETAGGNSSQEESCSTISPSPTVSPKPKARRTSKKADSPTQARKLSYRQPDESELLPPPLMKRELSRRKSCIEEIAEENLKHKNDKMNRRGSANRVSPIEQVQSPPKSQEKIKKRRSSLQQSTKPDDESALKKRPSVVRSDSAKQRIKASTVQTEKRKCAPRAPIKEHRKNVQKSGFCSII